MDGPIAFAAHVATCIALALPLAARAQRADTVIARRIAPGVSYRRFVDSSGPLVFNLVRIDLRRPELALRQVHAFDRLRGREKTTSMVRRIDSAGTHVLAAVNADFFDLETGENENNQVVNGEWWKGLKITDSPYDTYDNVHVQLAVDARGRPYMDRFILDGRAWAHGVSMPIITLNFNPSGTPEGSALYTPRFGATTPCDTTRATAEAPMIGAGRRGDTLLYVRRGPIAPRSGSPIPGDGVVLAAYGDRAKGLDSLRDGDTVRVLFATLPRLSGGAAPMLLVGGWPRILREGRNVAGDAATVEGTISRNAERRHARTAIGFSRDSSTLLLLTVDGRSTRSVGLTLTDLADHMRRLGAWNAMNLDGGGSATMVVDGALVNVPSDSAGERAVGNALMLVRR